MRYFFKRFSFFLVITLCLTNTQCDDDDLPLPPQVCDYQVLIDAMAYDETIPLNFNFLATQVIDNCLFIEISASGCNGDSWEVELIDSAIVAESSPEQRFLKFKLINEEVCLAVFDKTYTFNLEPLQVEGSNEIILNIEGYDGSVLYSY